MTKDFPLGLTFDDVLLVPQYCETPSRKLISTASKFSRRIKLNIPIVGANMDTVTEADMAAALALEGGIGVIHRFMSVDRQADEVRKVKRAENIVIRDPIAVTKELSYGEALAVMAKNRITSLLVCDAKNRLEGILTSRDVRFAKDPAAKVANLMTPLAKLITAPKGTPSAKAMKLLDQHKIEKLPLVDKRGRLTGLITASDFIKINKHQRAAKDKTGRLLVGAAVGIKDPIERGEKLVRAGADALVIDIAHGHHKLAIEVLKKLKRRFRQTDIIAGNVATAEAVRDLVKAGADAVKVGIGPGAACSTRIVAGSGVPQLTAIMEAKKFAGEVPIIGDGGIKNSGDLAKAIAAGASTVMIGNLFSGSKESPGEYYIEEGAAYKVYRGLASREASYDRQILEKNKEREERAPEGVSMKVPFRGEVKKILAMLVDGLQSGMSYTGAESVPEFWKKAQFVRITENGYKESVPRPKNGY